MSDPIRITETNQDRYTVRRVIEPADMTRAATESIHCRECGEEIVERLPTWHSCASVARDGGDDDGDDE